jgi:hypothetical protein
MAYNHYSIEQLAYMLWEARGHPEGSSLEDWLGAEQQLAVLRPVPPTECAKTKNAAVREWPSMVREWPPTCD